MDAEPGAPGGNNPAGGNPNPGAFDPIAFKTEILTEFRKDFNGGLKALKADFAKMLTPPKPGDPAPGGDPQPGGDPAPKPGGGNPQLEHEVRTLREQLNAEKAERQKATAEALEKERLASIKEALAGQQFGTDGYRGDAFRLLRDEIKRGEDGGLYGGDGVPLQDYVAQVVKARTDWHPPKAGSGSGAVPGNGRPATGSKWGPNPTIHLDPATFSKRTPAEQAEIRQAVATMQ